MKQESAFDFSIQNVPDTWRAAEGDAPVSDRRPLRQVRQGSIRTLTERVDIMTATIAALAVSVATGVTWFLFETRGVTESPLVALFVGLAISLAVRLGGGKGDPDIRATIAFVFYLSTVLITAYLIERHDFQITYRETPNREQTEYWLVRDRLTEPIVLLGWAAGLVLSTQISYITRQRRN